MTAWHDIVNWLSKNSHGRVNPFTAKLDPQGEALRHRLRAEVAAVTRMNKIAQRTVLMGEIFEGRRGQ